MSEVHVLLAADQARVREVLKQVIASQPDLYIASEAEDRRSALEKARQRALDVALIADTSEDVHGFLGEMCTSCPSTKVIELAATEDGRKLTRRGQWHKLGLVSRVDPMRTANARGWLHSR